MSDREPVKTPMPTTDEMVRHAYAMGYEQGVKDGAERADQWASNKYGLNGGDENGLVAWIMELLPASRDELAKRMR